MSNIVKRDALEFFAVVVLGVISIIFVAWYAYTHPHVTVKYDCSIAEISPDYPVVVKDGCRKLMMERSK